MASHGFLIAGEPPQTSASVTSEAKKAVRGDSQALTARLLKALAVCAQHHETVRSSAQGR